jgi:hypothetical protein
MQNLSDLLDAANIEGLALDRQPTGWVASLSFPPGYGPGSWSPLEFATTPSEAIAKALRLHAPRVEPAPVQVAPVADTPPALCPPPY